MIAVFWAAAALAQGWSHTFVWNRTFADLDVPEVVVTDRRARTAADALCRGLPNRPSLGRPMPGVPWASVEPVLDGVVLVSLYDAQGQVVRVVATEGQEWLRYDVLLEPGTDSPRLVRPGFHGPDGVVQQRARVIADPSSIGSGG